MIRLSENQRTLCKLLSSQFFEHTPSTEALFALINTDEVLQWAIDNELSSSLAFAVAQQHGWDCLQQVWRDQFEATTQRVSTYLMELDHVAESLSANDIHLVALKNAGIVRGIYPYPGACPMGDVDVLVEKHYFRKAHELLTKCGYCFEFRNPFEEAELPQAEREGGAEYWKELPSGDKFWFELQWRPVAGRWIRPDQEPSAAELMVRSIAIPGTEVRLLAPEDNLLQVALHTAKHSYVRAPGFRLHLDVERIVRAYPTLDWRVFISRVQQMQVKTAVYFSLLIPKELFETPIPNWVLEALQPPRWKESLLARMIQKAGLFNPHEQKFSKPGYILFNALLYDDFKGLLRGIFPAKTWMRERYGFHSNLLLPYYHGRRLYDLALRRMST